MHQKYQVALECLGKGLVVSEDHEGFSFQKEKGVLNVEVSGEMLPAENTAALFHRCQLLGEETERMPHAVDALLEHTSNIGDEGPHFIEPAQIG